MLRTILIQLAWFLLPFIVYGLYVHGLQRLFPKKTAPRPTNSRSVFVWLSACGLFLVAVSLFVFALIEGEPVGKEYAPPRFEQGIVVPGQFQ